MSSYADDVKARQEEIAAELDPEPQQEIEGSELAVSPEGVPYQGVSGRPAEPEAKSAKRSDK